MDIIPVLEIALASFTAMGQVVRQRPGRTMVAALLLAHAVVHLILGYSAASRGLFWSAVALASLVPKPETHAMYVLAALLVIPGCVLAGWPRWPDGDHVALASAASLVQAPRVLVPGFLVTLVLGAVRVDVAHILFLVVLHIRLWIY